MNYQLSAAEVNRCCEINVLCQWHLHSGSGELGPQ